MPAEYLDSLIRATGFDLDGTNYEYKQQWLLDRIDILKNGYERYAIEHDNPEVTQLIAMVQMQRRYEKAVQNTIAAYQVEVENLKKELKKLQRDAK